MLKAHEGGFVDLWFKQNVVDASRCLNPLRDSSSKPRLTLSGLSGAFVVLASGLFFSVFIFCAELILSRFIISTPEKAHL